MLNTHENTHLYMDSFIHMYHDLIKKDCYKQLANGVSRISQSNTLQPSSRQSNYYYLFYIYNRCLTTDWCG